jgi:DNA sulfur modification protein DndE
MSAKPGRISIGSLPGVVARVGLTANTPKEAVYFDDTLDSEGNPLTGAKKYTMTFQKTPPFHEPSFWALGMFD